MKKINQIIFTALLATGLMACTDNNETSQATADLKNYVDSVNRGNRDYTQEHWVLIDNGYQARARRAEAKLAEMNADQKAQYESSKTSYVALQSDYLNAINRKNDAMQSKIQLRDALFGVGNVGDDMSFSFVTSANMLSVYQSFVDAVDANKDNYSREDWDEIKLMYEALDNHKNMDEKGLSASDNMKIAGLKIKVSSIYDAKRPSAKARENSDAKG